MAADELVQARPAELVVIDAKALLFRAYFVARPRVSPRGVEVGDGLLRAFAGLAGAGWAFRCTAGTRGGAADTLARP